MIVIANYDDNNAVIGCTREDGVSGGLEFLVACEALGMTISYKTQAELDALSQSKAQADFRLQRDKLLAKADIQIYKLEDNGQDATAWRNYRQSLRDATLAWVLPTTP